MRNPEGYADPTASAAIGLISRSEYWARIDKEKKEMEVALLEAEGLLKEKGFHLEGNFRVVNKKNIYLKVRRA